MANTVKFDLILPSIRGIKKKLQQLPKEAYKEFVKNTPIRSGNARRKTKLKQNEIRADYPYAQRLDEGYSKQAPEGMTKPTQEFLQKRLKQIMRKK